uniref:Large ribosomal subunit protein mL52 n=1 Tax=Amphiprion ocellaris TaxID=80972 RepID=A0AAQ5Y309_AMPOC
QHRSLHQLLLNRNNPPHGDRIDQDVTTAQNVLFFTSDRHGLARSGTEYGPLTDLPDWSFADGRPAPPLKGHLRRKQERETLARRIVMLNSEVDQGIEMWREKQEGAKRMEEHKKSLLLKPKGQRLLKKKSQC